LLKYMFVSNPKLLRVKQRWTQPAQNQFVSEGAVA